METKVCHVIKLSTSGQVDKWTSGRAFRKLNSRVLVQEEHCFHKGAQCAPWPQELQKSLAWIGLKWPLHDDAKAATVSPSFIRIASGSLLKIPSHYFGNKLSPTSMCKTEIGVATSAAVRSIENTKQCVNLRCRHFSSQPFCFFFCGALRRPH